MFSPNQLYDYLRYYCYVNKKNATVRHFKINGSKNLGTLIPAEHIYTNVLSTDLHLLRETTGCVDMFDQEPVDITAYFEASCDTYPHLNQINFTDSKNFIFSRSAGIYAPIICHSEKNSDDINVFSDNYYTPVHFWSNGILSRYWFSHYEPLSKYTSAKKSKRFGTYIRSIDKTRKYRKDLLEFLESSIPNDIFCPYLINSQQYISSDQSAKIKWQDHTEFDIHVVSETLFNTHKVHLTEKVCKPIVMYQPFIIFGPPHSLRYLKKYGFKTFNEVWDESYDDDFDHDSRFNKLTKLIKYIATLDKQSYQKLLNKTWNITEYNRRHFYSDKFKELLMDELNTKLSSALNKQEESFFKMPGGTLFYYHDLYYKKTGHKPVTNKNLINLTRSLTYAYSKSTRVGDAIVKKYSHLL
jgi:hypothetical protein